jgi:hypothetical protein
MWINEFLMAAPQIVSVGARTVILHRRRPGLMGQALRIDPFSVAADPESMAALVIQFAPASDAEALRLLRASFPDCPLSARIAALAFLTRRQSARVSA